MSKAPAFQFYPSDFISDPTVQMMSNEEIGVYLKMLCFDWLGSGLVTEHERLFNLLGCNEQQLTVCLEKFEEIDGRYYNKRLRKEREKQENRREQASAAGRASGKKRATKRTKPEHPLNARSNSVERKSNPISLSSSISIIKEVEGKEPQQQLTLDGKPPEPKTNWKLIMEAWNASVPKMPNSAGKLITMADHRKKKIKTRSSELGLSPTIYIQKVIGNATNIGSWANEKGANGKGGSWFSFDWVIDSQKNTLKILEGNFGDGSGGSGALDAIKMPDHPKLTEAIWENLKRDATDKNHLRTLYAQWKSVL